MTGEEAEPLEEPTPEGPLTEPPVSDSDPMDAQVLADRVRDRAADLFTSIEPVGDHLVRAEGMPALLGDALTVLRDKLGMDELLAVTVVDGVTVARRWDRCFVSTCSARRWRNWGCQPPVP